MRFVIFFISAALIPLHTIAGIFDSLKEKTYSVKKAVKKKESYLRKPDKWGDVTLHRCIIRGTAKDDEDAKILIEAEIGLDITNKCGNLALHWALDKGKTELAKLMIAKDSQPLDVQNVNKKSPMHVAAREGFADIIQQMVERGGNVLLENDRGLTSLQVAAARNHCNVVRYLIGKAGIPVNSLNSNNLTALHVAARGGCIGVINVLVTEFHANKEANADEFARTPLAMAIQSKQVETAETLIKLGADPRYQFLRGPFEGASLFHLAVRTLVVKMADLLASVKGVDRYKKGLNGKTVLHFVSDCPMDDPYRRENLVGMLDWLLDSRIGDPFAKDGNGHNALAYAIRREDLDVAEYYLRRIKRGGLRR